MITARKYNWFSALHFVYFIFICVNLIDRITIVAELYNKSIINNVDPIANQCEGLGISTGQKTVHTPLENTSLGKHLA